MTNLFEQHPRSVFVLVFAAAVAAFANTPVATPRAAAVPPAVQPDGCAADEHAARADDAPAWRVPVVHHVRLASTQAGAPCAHDPRE